MTTVRFLTHTVQMKPIANGAFQAAADLVLNPHGSDETEARKILQWELSQFLTHTVQMKP